jgi:hypothetical protein
MSNGNTSTLNKEIIISRISLISGCVMQTELFEKLREEMADSMIEKLGFEYIEKISYMMPTGKYWQLQYGLK